MTTVYIDESGNGGLLDPQQPVFALSAIRISEAEAKAELEKFLPASLIGGNGERKHDSLSKRIRNGIQKRLGDLQVELVSKYDALSYVVDKRHILIAKMLSGCIAGDDWRILYLQDFTRTLYANYAHLCKVCQFDKILKAYNEAIGCTPDDRRFAERFKSFVAATKQAIQDYPPLNFILGDIANEETSCVEEFTFNSGHNIHASMLFGLVNELLKLSPEPIDIVCDDSPQYGGVQKLFDIHPFGASVHSVSSDNSRHSCGLQLADLLAGGARFVGERQFGRKNHGKTQVAYVERLVELYDKSERLLYQPASTNVSIFARMQEVAAHNKFRSRT